MARTIDEIVAFHIGVLSLNVCRRIREIEELQEEVANLKDKINVKEAKDGSDKSTTDARPID